MRLKIELTEEQHQHIKSAASMEGKSLQDYVLDKVLKNSTEILDESEDENPGKL